jgi:MYXO-CTERM domain-containing protein
MDRALSAGATLVVLVLAAAPSFAGPSPASGQPYALWGELQPLDTALLPADRDHSAFDGLTMSYQDTALAMGVDIGFGYVFLATNWGLQIWETHDFPALKVGEMTWQAFPVQAAGADAKQPVRGVALPWGDDDIAALACAGGMGLVIVDTKNKAAPFVLYQDGAAGSTKSGSLVYATAFGAKRYAFYVDTVGLRAYDLTEAAKITTPKYSEDAPSPTSMYPNVYLGMALNPPGRPARAVGGFERFVITGSTLGLDLWDATDPQAPVHLGSGEDGAAIAGVAMWQDTPTTYYAAAVVELSPTTVELRTYNVSFVIAGSTATIPPAISKTSLLGVGMPSELGRLTFSYGVATPFLHYTAGVEPIHDPTAVAKRPAALFDVSDPIHPRDVTPSPHLLNGAYTTYWGWSLQYGNVVPIAGKFYGNVFYQASRGIFDFHLWSDPSLSGTGGGSTVGSSSSGGTGGAGTGGHAAMPSGCGCSVPAGEGGLEAGVVAALAALALRRRRSPG